MGTSGESVVKSSIDPLLIVGDRYVGLLTSGNAPGEGFLTWYSGDGGVGDAIDRCISLPFDVNYTYLEVK